MAAQQGNAPEIVQSDDETAMKEDFQSLREIIHEEGGAKDNGDEDDDDETCGFCRFMKAGGCKKEFTAWSECVDTNRGEGHNFTEECRDATLDLQKCMEDHRDYYRDFMLDSEPGQGPDGSLTTEPETGEADKTGGKEEDGKGPVEAATDTAKDAAASVKDTAMGAAASAMGTAKDVAASVKDTAKDVATSAKDTAMGTAKDAAASAKDSAVGAAKDAAATAKDAAMSAATSAKDTAGDVAKGAAATAQGTAKDAAASAKDTAKEAATSAKDTAKDAAASAKDTAKDAAASAKDTAKDAAASAKDTAKEAAASAKDTAKDAAASAKDNAKDAATSVAGAAEGAVEAVSDTMEEPKGPVYSHASSADTGVDEPLPPTDRLLSGLEGEFQAKDDNAQPDQEDSSAEEGGEAKEGDDSAEAGAESGEEGEEEEEEEPKPVIELKTASHDPRFPSTNQARHCYTRYNEYHRCVAQKGEDDPECSVFQRAYRSICPSDWLERWNEARENGTWPGRY